MKKSYKFFIVAIGLIVPGFALYESIGHIDFEPNEIEDIPIEPNSSYTFHLVSDGKINMWGYLSSVPTESPFNVKIFNPDGSILLEENSQEAPIYLDPKERNVTVVELEFFNPNPEGNLKVVITNFGEQQGVVSGFVHESVHEKQYDDIWDAVISDELFYSLLFAAISGLLVLSGFILAIIGGIIFFKERKNVSL